MAYRLGEIKVIMATIYDTQRLQIVFNILIDEMFEARPKKGLQIKLSASAIELLPNGYKDLACTYGRKFRSLVVTAESFSRLCSQVKIFTRPVKPGDPNTSANGRPQIHETMIDGLAATHVDFQGPFRAQKMRVIPPPAKKQRYVNFSNQTKPDEADLSSEKSLDELVAFIEREQTVQSNPPAVPKKKKTDKARNRRAKQRHRKKGVQILPPLEPVSETGDNSNSDPAEELSPPISAHSQATVVYPEVDAEIEEFEKILEAVCVSKTRIKP
jgi:hypothetical protein